MCHLVVSEEQERRRREERRGNKEWRRKKKRLRNRGCRERGGLWRSVFEQGAFLSISTLTA